MGRSLLAAFSLSASLALALLSSEARAGATVDLLFVARNGGAIAPSDSVTASPGDTLTMAVLVTNDEAIIRSVFSLNYDLDGDDELDVITVFQWNGVPINKAGTEFYTPLFALSPSTATFVGSFSSGSTSISLPEVLPPATGPFAGGYQVGTVVWQVNAGVNTDGADIISGILNVGTDFFADATLNAMDARVLFNAATVNVPEPGTAALVGLALLGLALARRPRS